MSRRNGADAIWLGSQYYMIKNTNLCVDLKTVMQKDALLVEGHCYNGILCRDSENHFRFEEAIRKGHAPLNPKIFDGKRISMVRKSNGKYQIHMKAMGEKLDREKFALEIYGEVVSALKIIE